MTDPVAYVNTTIQGTGGTSDSALTFVGLSVTQPVNFQGTIGSYNGATHMLTPANGTFTPDQFNGTNGSYFVEITSGTAAGVLSDITATNGSPSSITTADDLSSQLSGGESFKIRKHWTLESVFGPNPNTSNQVILGAGSGPSRADEVLVYDRSAQQYLTYYYKNSGTGGTGWRSTDSSFDDKSNTVLRVTDGMIIRRKLSAAVVLSLPGAVKLGPTRRLALPGLNFFGDVYASGTTLANSGLYDAAHPENSLQGGGASTADQVLIYDGSQYAVYYYKIGGFGGDGWRSTNLALDRRGQPPLPAGQSILVRRFLSQSFVWVAPQPFVIAP